MTVNVEGVFNAWVLPKLQVLQSDSFNPAKEKSLYVLKITHCDDESQ